MKTVDTSLLRIAYEEWNPQAEHAIVLLHGWPDSTRCWAEVAPELAAAGYRVIVPALRGFSHHLSKSRHAAHRPTRGLGP